MTRKKLGLGFGLFVVLTIVAVDSLAKKSSSRKTTVSEGYGILVRNLSTTAFNLTQKVKGRYPVVLTFFIKPGASDEPSIQCQFQTYEAAESFYRMVFRLKKNKESMLRFQTYEELDASGRKHSYRICRILAGKEWAKNHP